MCPRPEPPSPKTLGYVRCSSLTFQSEDLRLPEAKRRGRFTVRGCCRASEATGWRPGDSRGTECFLGTGQGQVALLPPLLGPRAPFFWRKASPVQRSKYFPWHGGPGQLAGEPEPAVESVGTPRWGAWGRQGGYRRGKERFSFLFYIRKSLRQQSATTMPSVEKQEFWNFSES